MGAVEEKKENVVVKRPIQLNFKMSPKVRYIIFGIPSIFASWWLSEQSIGSPNGMWYGFMCVITGMLGVGLILAYFLEENRRW